MLCSPQKELPRSKKQRILRSEWPTEEVPDAATQAAASAQNATGATGSTGSESVEQELSELKDMLDKGLITQQDYDAKKKQLLDGM